MNLNRRSTWRTVVAACATAGVLLAGTSAAQAANYYDIVNTDTGQALQVDSSGKLRMATPNAFVLGQQFKFTEADQGGAELFHSSVTNRLGSCLVDNDSLWVTGS